MLYEVITIRHFIGFISFGIAVFDVFDQFHNPVIHALTDHQGFNSSGGCTPESREQRVGIYAQCLKNIINNRFDLLLTSGISHQNAGQRADFARFAVVTRGFEPASYNFV